MIRARGSNISFVSKFLTIFEYVENFFSYILKYAGCIVPMAISIMLMILGNAPEEFLKKNMTCSHYESGLHCK